jgi:hypothetical protein
LKGSWRYHPQAKQLPVALDQMQSQGLYRMPIEIGISMPLSATSQTESASGPFTQLRGPRTRLVKMLIDKQHNVLNIPVDTEPKEVQIDPNLWVPLTQVAFQKQ